MKADSVSKKYKTKKSHIVSKYDKNKPLDEVIEIKEELNTDINNAKKKNNENLPPITRKISITTLDAKFNKKNMIVAVRNRPLNKRELDYSNYNTIDILEKDTLSISIPVEYTKNEEGEYYIGKNNYMTIKKIKDSTFKFDFVFGETTPQDEVYRCTSSTLVKQATEGFNATIFAYGATGSGKTYTMVGNGENAGIMIRTIRDLFKFINKDKNNKKYNVSISYVEVYNETLKDLLKENENTQVEIRNDPQKGVILQGADFVNVTNEFDAFKLIMKGNRKRTEKPTENNENSSRSHAILQIHLEIENQEVNLQREISFGKFILVDLAGSEKISQFNSVNNESGSINKSLLALANCINLLVSNSKRFIPWRDSKLTRILQESLSGNSRIVMIATISPALSNFEETMYTLQYANRAKNLKVNIKKNIRIEQINYASKYDDVIRDLKLEIEKTKNQILEQEKINDQINIEKDNEILKNKEKNEEYNKIKADIETHFQNEINLKKTIIEKENAIEEMKNELCEKECNIINSGNKNLNDLKNQITNKKNEIQESINKIATEYNKQYELTKKRKEFQTIIMRLTVMDPNNSQVKNLFGIYRYYVALLENIATEHRKYVNICELKRKEKKIYLLTEQLDLRDKFIVNAGIEISNNNILFKYNNPNLITADELEMDPSHPQIMKISPSFVSSEVKNIPTINNYVKKDNFSSYTNNNDTSQLNKKTILNSSASSNNKNYNFKDKINEINNFKKKIVGEAKVTKKRQYNNELLPLFNIPKYKINKNPDMGINLNNFQRRFGSQEQKKRNNILLSAGVATIQNNNNVDNEKTTALDNFINSEFSRKKKNIGRNEVKYNRYGVNKSKYSNLGNNSNNNNSKSFSNDNSFSKSTSQIEATHTTKLENEIQRKVRTILKKDFIGRYKKSPYLKLLNE